MKKQINRIVSSILFVAMLVSCVSMGVSAISYDTIVADTYVTYRDSYGATSTYSSDIYYDQLQSVPLTGDGARDSVAVAMSQCGYLEGDDYDRSGTTGGSGNYTEFGYYMDCDGYAWCASFCSFVYYNARVTDLYGYNNSCGNNMYSYGYWWSDTYVPNWSNQLDYYGMYKSGHYYGGSYTPQPGDTIFFTYYETQLDEDHIGMVVYSDGSYVYTIEGNTSSQDGLDSEGGGVFFKKYSLWSSNIAGYGAMPFDTVSDLPDIDYSGENPSAGIYVALSADSKVLYSDNTCTTISEYVPYGTMFEVISVSIDDVGDTLLYSKVVLDGVTQYGYIVHGSDTNGYAKTLQIYVNDAVPEITSSKYNVTEDYELRDVFEGATANEIYSNISTDGTGVTYAIYDGGTKVANTAKVATGMTLRLIQNSTTVSTYTIIVKGDVNCDGKVTGLDYVLVKRHVNGTCTLGGDALSAAHVFNKSTVDVLDYLSVKRHVLGTYVIK